MTAASIKRYFSLLVVVTFLSSIFLFFQNCGGGGGGGAGGDNPTQKSTPAGLGTFVDDPVAGLTYVTSSGLTGVTDSLGQFQYNPGDTVTFYALGVSIGSTTPTISSDGTSTVTPIDLVPGATDVTDPQVTAIAQFLSTLNSIAASGGSSVTGTFIIPSSSATPSPATSTLSASQLQNILDSIFGAGTYTITAAAAAQANLQQGLNSQGIIGTVWRGTCSSGCTGGGTIYFQSNGIVAGFTDDGSVLGGAWSTDSAGTHLNVSTQNGSGGGKNGFIATGANTGTMDIYNDNGDPDGLLTMVKVTSNETLTGSSYMGVWYITYTPNAYGISIGDNGGGSAYLVAGPSVYYAVLDDGKQLSGAISSSGTATGSFNDGKGTNYLSINFLTQSGTVSENGQVKGNLTLSHSGSFSVNKNNNGGGGTGGSPGGSPSYSGTPGPTSTPTTPTPTPPSTPTPTATPTPTPVVMTSLLLNLQISWANAPQTANSIAVELTVKNSNGISIAHQLNSESMGGGDGSGNRITTTDNIATSFAQGEGVSYQVTFGNSPCSATSGGSGAIEPNGTYQNQTVMVTCN